MGAAGWFIKAVSMALFGVPEIGTIMVCGCWCFQSVHGRCSTAGVLSPPVDGLRTPAQSTLEVLA